MEEEKKEEVHKHEDSRVAGVASGRVRQGYLAATAVVRPSPFDDLA